MGAAALPALPKLSDDIACAVLLTPSGECKPSSCETLLPEALRIPLGIVVGERADSNADRGGLPPLAKLERPGAPKADVG